MRMKKPSFIFANTGWHLYFRFVVNGSAQDSTLAVRITSARKYSQLFSFKKGYTESSGLLFIFFMGTALAHLKYDLYYK